MNVLLVRLRSLGDTVLMTPALAVLRRAGTRGVAVAVEEPFDEVLRGNPAVDEIIVVKRNKPGWLARCSALRRLRAWHPDLAIDLHGGTTSALLTRFCGAPRRAGYGASRNAALYNLRIPPSSQVWGRADLHTVEHQLSALKYLDFPVDPLPPVHIPVAASLRSRLEVELSALGMSPGFVLIHPAAAFDTKQWHSDKFARLASQLKAEGHAVLVTAGPGQETLLEEMRGRCDPEVRFLKPQPLSRFIALASLCGLYIGNDTGTTHVAAGLGRKVVAIFGSSDYRVWHPWQTEYRLLRSDLPCIPCPGYRCLHYDQPRCIRSIEVEPVLEAARSLL